MVRRNRPPPIGRKTYNRLVTEILGSLIRTVSYYAGSIPAGATNTMSTRIISYGKARRADKAILERWLTWSIKNDPARERIIREQMNTKTDILDALVWIGAIP